MLKVQGNRLYIQILRLLALLGFFVFSSAAYSEPASVELPVSKENSISLSKYEANGSLRYLWFCSAFGITNEEREIAKRLAAQSVEVWIPDLFASYFLPQVPSSIEEIPGEEVAELIEKARSVDDKRLILIASDRNAVTMLRGIHAWQKKYASKATLDGVILIGPKLYSETPEPGKEPEFLPIVHATNVPIVMIQAQKSPWHWRLANTINAFQEAGSDIYAWSLAEVRDRFYYRPDATAVEQSLAKQVPKILQHSVGLLSSYAQKPRQAANLSTTQPAPRAEKKERQLQVYSADPQPPPLRLQSLDGSNVDLQDLKGSVVLVNFWATWCPPCVHEMPSMQRLQTHFQKQDFSILAVNMAEEAAVVKKFVTEQVKVNFTVLLDRDGAVLNQWKVFAYPTSFVIDKRGNIRYALFGAIEWDTDEVIKKIKPLLNETSG